MSEKGKILEYIRNPKTTKAVNIMGCSENWYDPYYAIQKTFSYEEVAAMSETEIEHLIKLAENIAEGLY